MSKLQIVLSRIENVSFKQPWLIELFQNYFNIVFVEDNPIVDSKAIFATRCTTTEKWYKNYIDKGHKLIVDNLWEIPKKFDNCFVLNNKNWFWYNESLWYSHLNYHNHTPNPNITHNGLLLINRHREHRLWIFNKLDKSKLLYSYVEKGFIINGDIEKNEIIWQRYFNPVWYNSTAFSIVVETNVYKHTPFFVTEKTFKPLAFQHPFIVFGQTGVLDWLKSLGFTTFENLFDETYDTDVQIANRLENIVKQINNYVHTPYDSITTEKLKHNKELFYNEKVVKNKILNEVIYSILEYAET